MVKVGESIPAKVVYVHNRDKWKEYLCLICTGTSLDENKINDNRSLGELFLYISDEMADILLKTQFRAV